MIDLVYSGCNIFYCFFLSVDNAEYALLTAIVIFSGNYMRKYWDYIRQKYLLQNDCKVSLQNTFDERNFFTSIAFYMDAK